MIGNIAPQVNALREASPVHKGSLSELLGMPRTGTYSVERDHYTIFSFTGCDQGFRDNQTFSSEGLWESLGVQTLAARGERLQGFAQLLAGANVHGKSAKAGVGARWLLDDRLALNLGIGRIEARSAGGGQFKADNVSVGLDYRFSVPTR